MPVGEDQIQHIEFARECATNFNTLHSCRCLTEPVALICKFHHGARALLASHLPARAKKVMSLKDPQLKMSKSHSDPRSRILLSDSDDEIKAKIRMALTDSNPTVTYAMSERPGVSNLLNIILWLRDSQADPTDFAENFRGWDLRAFKDLVAEEIIKYMSDIRARYTQALTQGPVLEELAREGAGKAQDNGLEVLGEVYETIGLRGKGLTPNY